MSLGNNFSALSFSARCALMETKRERKEQFPDKDIDAYLAVRGVKRRRASNLGQKYREYLKKKLARANQNPILYIMEIKMTEKEIAAVLLSVGWDYEGVKAYAKARGFAEPSNTDIFWGGFIAGGVEYYNKRQEFLKELDAEKRAVTIDI